MDNALSEWKSYTESHQIYLLLGQKIFFEYTVPTETRSKLESLA